VIKKKERIFLGGCMRVHARMHVKTCMTCLTVIQLQHNNCTHHSKILSKIKKKLFDFIFIKTKKSVRVRERENIIQLSGAV
jgi:hydroxyacyl-ACP dehydratase HTD2-like protein with hotdog domain